jgi:hypothetical protein
MHYVTRRSHQMQKHKFSVMCPATLFIKTAPGIGIIIVRNHGDDEEDEWDIKRMLERQGDAHIKVEIQSNMEF